MCKKNYLLIGSENDPKEQRFSKITKNHIILFLKTLNQSKHYENVHLIHYVLTGQKPNDISHLENKLMNDFEIVLNLYDKNFVQDSKRKNFINGQYILFQLLRHNNYPCKKEDFLMLKTNLIKECYDEICKKIFDQLHWNITQLHEN